MEADLHVDPETLWAMKLGDGKCAKSQLLQWPCTNEDRGVKVILTRVKKSFIGSGVLAALILRNLSTRCK
jgi:hypothetical protein